MSDSYFTSAHPFSIEALTSSLDAKSLSHISATEFQKALLDVTTAEDSLDASIGGRRTPDLGSEGSSPQQSPSGSVHTSPSSQSDSSSSGVEQLLCKLDGDVNKLVNRKGSPTKPQLSFVAIISQAILRSPGKKLLLGDIYKYFSDNYEYYNNEQRTWRNSIRHNLSINECFIKDGRVLNKGHYWAIHPACQADFSKGDYRRRNTRRHARRINSAYAPHLPSTVYPYPAELMQNTPKNAYQYHPYQRYQQQHQMYYAPPTGQMQQILPQARMDMYQKHGHATASYPNHGYSQAMLPSGGATYQPLSWYSIDSSY